ncbi:MAG TPA: hypothetical protein EYP53_02980 [Candidatus Latescibacteria bacterium]|nr:hypothetical protein [Candidatus Latescibacterota bacterium]
MPGLRGRAWRAAISIVLIWPITVVLSGCTEHATRLYKEGRLYVVNNACPHSREEPRWVTVEWEGESILVDPNMDEDGEPTGVGAVLITPASLPGGTEIDFVFNFRFVGEIRSRRLSEVLPSGQKAIIDGDITIDIYSLRWDPSRGLIIDCTARVISGKFDGIHPYPELQ